MISQEDMAWSRVMQEMDKMIHFEKSRTTVRLKSVKKELEGIKDDKQKWWRPKGGR